MCLQVICVCSRASGMLASLQRERHSNYQNTTCVIVDWGRSDTLNKTNGTFHKCKHAPYVAALKNWCKTYIQPHIPALKSLLYINAVLKGLQCCSTVKKYLERKKILLLAYKQQRIIIGSPGYSKAGCDIWEVVTMATSLQWELIPHPGLDIWVNTRSNRIKAQSHQGTVCQCEYGRHGEEGVYAFI